MTTLKILADRLGLSIATVSRVLNTRTSDLVSAATKERVLALAAELGYRPNPAARALVTGRTHTIGLLTFAMHPAFYSQVIQELHDLLARDRYRLAIVETPRQRASDADLARIMAVAVDGLLAFDSPEMVRTLIRQGGDRVPVPMVGLGTATTPEIDAVQVVNDEGATEILDHWHRAGRRRVAYLGMATDRQWPQRRIYAAHRQVAGLPEIYLDVDSCSPAAQRDGARAAVLRQLRRAPRPDAVFAFNDECAIGTLRALHELGIDVPGQTAVAGCDGIAEGAYHQPSLATIQFPVHEVCREAWRLLKGRLNGKDAPPRSRVFTAKPVWRESA